MIRLPLLFLFSFVALSLYSQRLGLPESVKNLKAKFAPVHIVDSALLECVYAVSEVDTVLGQARDHEVILLVGRDYSKFLDLYRYKKDSLYASHNFDMTWGEATSLTADFRESYEEEILRDGNTFWMRKTFILDPMEYGDSSVFMDWTLHSDTLTVCGYLCRKATTRFRGKSWEVWYSDDLPFDGGPWKFCNLPGLVLKASDSCGLHDFTAVEVRLPHVAVIDTKRRWSRISREKYLELSEAVADGRLRYSSPSNPVLDGDGNVIELTRKFYSPLELE